MGKVYEVHQYIEEKAKDHTPMMNENRFRVMMKETGTKKADAYNCWVIMHFKKNEYYPIQGWIFPPFLSLMK